MSQPSPVQIFHQYLPPASIPYCYDLWKRYPFELKLRNPRQTKIGDFCARRNSKPVITLNKDLYPYMFLVTYIHEFAHHAVHIVYGNLPESHGKEWKLAFKTFMGPVMDMNIFPDDLQHCLGSHLKNPKATSFSDPHLTALFRKYDPASQHKILLSHVKEGDMFLLSGKRFRKGALQRTRVLCVEIKTRRQYLVARDAEVEFSPAES
jgi:SprT protein